MQSDSIIVSYERISTLRQLDGAGLETQRAKILDFCKAKGWQLGRSYQDIGVSGAVKDREGLMRLLSDCSKGQISKVLIYRRDRLGRDLFVTLWIEKELKKYNVELISVTENHVDESTPIGQAFANLTSIFAQLELDTITFRLKDGRQHASRLGKLASSIAPFGFYRDGKRLKVNETERPWISKIYRLASAGYPCNFIAKQLNKAGLKTRRGLSFQSESIKYILQNKIYIGEINYGTIKGVKGEHEVLVSRRSFFRTQRVLAEKKIQKT